MKKTIENISTVIVTDIVGYSKLTGDNQDLALELLAEHDKIIIESIKLFNIDSVQLQHVYQYRQKNTPKIYQLARRNYANKKIT